MIAENGFWPRDAVHFPRALSPLGASIVPALEYDGIDAAAAELALPVRILARVVDGFVYNNVQPRAPSPAEQEALERRHAIVMAEQIARLPRRWREEYTPELRQNNRHLGALNVQAANGDELLRRLDETLRLLARHWQIHFLVVLPVFAAGGNLVRSYEALFQPGDHAPSGPVDERAPYRLLQGFENETLAADQALWEIARLAHAAPAVAATLRADNTDLEAIRRLPGSRSFVAAFDRFLAAHGQRVAAADDVIDPTWAEDPSFPLGAIAGYLVSAGESPESRRLRQAAEREGEIARLLGALGDDGAEHSFLHVLRETQAVWPLRESHTHLIDQPSFALLRRLFLVFGERLTAAGLTDTREDVFMLSRAEVEATLQQPEDRRALVAARRAEYQRRLQTEPPPFLGTPPAADAPPPDQELLKFFGRAPEPQSNARLISGIAASPGRARGVARIVLSPADFAAVQPGDILVCPSTTPPWTPLFGLVAAVVTDAGGVLSHGAIVAREYGLPAVTGARNATSRLRNGQQIEVDGDAGLIRLLE